MKRLLFAAISVVGLTALITGLALTFGSDSADDHPPSEPTGDESKAAVATVCKAAAAAGSGDVESARAIFDRAHNELHSLATAAAAKDRSVAARLLEAKQRVEATLTTAPAATLATHLEALIEPTRSAATVAGWPAPDPCPGNPR